MPVKSEGIANICDIRFNMTSYDEVLREIATWKKDGRRGYIVLGNPHSVLCTRRDREAKDAISQANLILPDGIGILLIAKLLGVQHNGRVTGPMLMLNAMDLGRLLRLRHYFYGGTESVAEKLVSRFTTAYPGVEIVGTYCPPFRALSPAEDAHIVATINAAKADVIWVGLGAPKQEKWMLYHRDKIEATAMIGVGAAFDFHSDTVAWAPRWIRDAGLEWAFRLVKEPKRLWRRNLDSLPFLFLALSQHRSRSS